MGSHPDATGSPTAPDVGGTVPLMTIAFDPAVDAAYIPIGDGPGPGEAVRQIADISGPAGGEIILDFDAEGRLLGIELLGATLLLRPEVLQAAPLPGS